MKKSSVQLITALTLGLISAMVGMLVVSCGAPVKQQVEAPKAAGKKCLECHPEFAARFAKGNVHAPVKAGDCYGCHRPHGIFGKILLRTDQPVLCYACHPAVKPKDTDKSIHKPLTTEKCTVCHNPHNSDYKALLAKEEKESCFACHDREEFQQQFIHAPLNQGCGVCHIPHSSPNEMLLRQATADNCKSCHDIGQPGFTQAHFKYPVKTGCTLCHSPHSGISKVLLKKVVHDPVRKGQCDSCHTLGANATIQTKQEPDKLCLQCHEIARSGQSIHQPYMQGKCTTCHDVHASNYTVLLTDAPERVCLSCHATDTTIRKSEAKTADEKGNPPAAGEGATKKPGQNETPVVSLITHKPVSEGKCLGCHKGHSAGQKSLLKEEPATLCFGCHEQKGYAAGGNSHSAAPGQACATCHVPHQSKVRALLRGEKERDLCFGCHKNTAVERGRYSQHKPFAQGECGVCHQLHRPKVSGFLKEEYSRGTLCLKCHEDKQKGAENFTVHEPVRQGECNRCHSPHAGDYDYVLRQPERELCFSCHKAVQQAYERAEVKHKPLADGKCTDCHTAHGSANANILKQGQPKLCLGCHVSVAEFWVDGSYHEPASKNCLQCHNSHGSSLAGLLTKPSGQLCGECHDTKTEAFSKAHQQITPSPESCVGCHSPHGSPVKSMLYPVVHKPFAEKKCSPCHPGR